MKAQVMRKAWGIFKKEGVRTMAAWSQALRRAWAIVKGVEKEVPARTTLAIRHQPSGGKEWIAEIVGRHAKNNFERRFLNPVAREWSYSGRTGRTVFELEEGKIYEVCEPYNGRYFVEVVNGRVYEIKADAVLARIA
ncbi:MAG: hypothetical protein H0Z34_15530 [Brevibacillus sp.]|nr:hypothetical protein [Brevibacillus sp.]